MCAMFRCNRPMTSEMMMKVMGSESARCTAPASAIRSGAMPRNRVAKSPMKPPVSRPVTSAVEAQMRSTRLKSFAPGAAGSSTSLSSTVQTSRNSPRA